VIPIRTGETDGNYRSRVQAYIDLAGAEYEDGVVPEDWKDRFDDVMRTAQEHIDNMNSAGQQIADQHGYEAGGPGIVWFEKLAEANMFFEARQRLHVTDMRMTMASFGPDFGRKIGVGLFIASDNAATVDLFASAALKEATDNDTQEVDADSEVYQNFPDGIGPFKAVFENIASRADGALEALRFIAGGDAAKMASHAAWMTKGRAPINMSRVTIHGELPERMQRSKYLIPQD